MKTLQAGLALGCLISLALAKNCNVNLNADNSDADLCVPQLIQKYGYPVEIHNNITTPDEYILTAHRIPYLDKCKDSDKRGVVYLQHGLLGDSSNWVIAGPEKGLAYNLADECYDVWMGNLRGTTYTRRHVKLHPIRNKNKFWNFSWHEMGINDVPTYIDYMLEQTGEDALYYVGHSMGTTAFWVMMSEKPEYNSKVKLMSAYAPIAYTRWMVSPIRHIAPIAGSLKQIMAFFGVHELLYSGPILDFFGKTVCHQNSLIQPICSNILFLVAGYDVDQLDTDLLPSILGHVPAGSSVRNIVHYAQGINSGKFRKYNYGTVKNLVKYGSVFPPQYEIEKVTVPVALYWGQNDWLSAKKDYEKLVARLPNLVKNHVVDHPKYNHLDFLWAKDNIELLNKQTIEFMKNY